MALELNTAVEVIKGKFDKIPDLSKKVVRIFLSSTFTGFKKIFLIIFLFN